MTQKDRKEIATFIKIERVKQDLKQSDLAKKAKVATKSLSSIENEEVVRDSTIQRVIGALGYNLIIVKSWKIEKIDEMELENNDQSSLIPKSKVKELVRY